ncbi:hypothetical protein MKEN_00619700 [Mycena kentingensis (nom. inval.)]|nr:hypothetical protein MKEN_00619700 [Mycena kentingensis (nom. inval.)]
MTLSTSSCDRCASAGSVAHSTPRFGAFVEEGEVRSAEYTSIRIPLLGLVEDTGASSICSRKSKLEQQATGKPRRPCLVLDNSEKNPKVCLMATFSGAEAPPSVFRDFMIPVFTKPERVADGAVHVHSTPEWKHADGSAQWILGVPFRPRVSDLDELKVWDSKGLPGGACFDPETVAKIHELAALTLVAWQTKSSSDRGFRQNVEKHILAWESRSVATSRRSTGSGSTRKTTSSQRSNARSDARGFDSCVARNTRPARGPPTLAPIDEHPASRPTTTLPASCPPPPSVSGKSRKSIAKRWNRKDTDAASVLTTASARGSRFNVLNYLSGKN